jgi:LPS export ABC transporter protein LptC
MKTPEPHMILTFALLLAGAIVSGFVLVSSRDDEAPKARPELSFAFYLDQAEITGTGKDGELRYQIWTERATQETAESNIDLTRIRMRYGDSEKSWELKANGAIIPAETSMIVLRGNIIAASTDQNDNTMIIRTQQLDIDTETKVADTRRKVVLEVNGSKLNATGLHIDLENNQLKLLSNVNEKFLP